MLAAHTLEPTSIATPGAGAGGVTGSSNTVHVGPAGVTLWLRPRQLEGPPTGGEGMPSWAGPVNSVTWGGCRGLSQSSLSAALCPCSYETTCSKGSVSGPRGPHSPQARPPNPSGLMSPTQPALLPSTHLPVRSPRGNLPSGQWLEGSLPEPQWCRLPPGPGLQAPGCSLKPEGPQTWGDQSEQGRGTTLGPPVPGGRSGRVGGLRTWLWRSPGRCSGPPCPPRCRRPPRHQRAECGRRSRPQTEPRWAATEPACPTRRPRASPAPAARPRPCPQSTPSKHRAGALTLSSSASMLKFISAILSNGALKEQLGLRPSLRGPVPLGGAAS